VWAEQAEHHVTRRCAMSDAYVRRVLVSVDVPDDGGCLSFSLFSPCLPVCLS